MFGLGTIQMALHPPCSAPWHKSEWIWETNTIRFLNRWVLSKPSKVIGLWPYAIRTSMTVQAQCFKLKTFRPQTLTIMGNFTLILEVVGKKDITKNYKNNSGIKVKVSHLLFKRTQSHQLRIQILQNRLMHISKATTTNLKQASLHSIYLIQIHQSKTWTYYKETWATELTSSLSRFILPQTT